MQSLLHTNRKYLYDTKELGGGFTLLIYVSAGTRQWYYTLINVEYSISIESIVPYAVMEYCISDAIGAAVDVLKKLTNTVVELEAENLTEMYVVFRNAHTGAKLLDSIILLQPQKYFVNLMVFKLLLIIKEGYLL